MTNEEAKHKMDFLKKAYQKLIDEKVDSGKLIGDGVMGEWKAETPLDEAYRDIIEALEMAIKALQQTRWIPVSERVPEENGMYLISTCMNCIDTCLFYKDDDGYLWVDYEESVIAWMPLPQPYKAESEDEE